MRFDTSSPRIGKGTTVLSVMHSTATNISLHVNLGRPIITSSNRHGPSCRSLFTIAFSAGNRTPPEERTWAILSGPLRAHTSKALVFHQVIHTRPFILRTASRCASRPWSPPPGQYHLPARFVHLGGLPCVHVSAACVTACHASEILGCFQVESGWEVGSAGVISF